MLRRNKLEETGIECRKTKTFEVRWCHVEIDEVWMVDPRETSHTTNATGDNRPGKARLASENQPAFKGRSVC